MNTLNQRERLSKLLEAPPFFHDWGRGPCLGGMNSPVLHKVLELCLEVKAAGGALNTFETGGGLSTLAFLLADPSEHICVEKNSGTLQNLDSYLSENNWNTSALKTVCGRVEVELPPLCLKKSPFLDFALLDGDHGWPGVFVELCYVNMILKCGAYLAIDDLQLYSVRQMAQFLKHQPGWVEVYQKGKFIVFRKDVSYAFFPGCLKQPFVMMNKVDLDAADPI